MEEESNYEVNEVTVNPEGGISYAYTFLEDVKREGHIPSRTELDYKLLNEATIRREMLANREYWRKISYRLIDAVVGIYDGVLDLYEFVRYRIFFSR